MGPPSYMCSVVDRNVVTGRVPVLLEKKPDVLDQIPDIVSLYLSQITPVGRKWTITVNGR